MTEQNKTAAYNAAKMARSRLSKAQDKSTSQKACEALLFMEEVLDYISMNPVKQDGQIADRKIRELAGALRGIPKAIASGMDEEIVFLLNNAIKTWNATYGTDD